MATTLTFGVAPIDMTEPDYLGLEAYFPGDLVFLTATPSEIFFRDSISGTQTIVTGSFAVPSPSDALNAIITGYRFVDSSGGLLAEWIGTGLRLGQLVNLSSQALLVITMQGADEVRGTVFTDRLLGFGGDDLIIGRIGHDFIDGGTGADRMEGGGGNNTYIVDNVGDVVVEDPALIQPPDLHMRIASATKGGQQIGTVDLQPFSNKEIQLLSFSADGRHLAFSAPDTHLLPGSTSASPDIYIKDLLTGDLVRVEAPIDRQGFSRAANGPSLSPDGRYLAFDDGQLVFVVDLTTGVIRSAGTGPSGPSGTLLTGGTGASVSLDGGTVVFTTPGAAPGTGPGTGPPDVLLRDLDAGLEFEALTPGSLLIVDRNASTLSEYSPSGELLQQYRIASPAGETAPALRDAVVDATGRVLLYNGTFAPALTVLNPATGVQSHHGASGWSTVDNTHYGGLDVSGNFVFATDMLTGADAANQIGLIRFDTSTFAPTRFAATQQYTDVTVGLDGLVYALSLSGAIDVFNANTLAPVRTITSATTPSLSAIAVGSDGTIYGVANFGSLIVALDGSGSVLASKGGFFASLASLDLRADGKIVAGTGSGDVILTDTSLSTVTSFHIPGASTIDAAWHLPPDAGGSFVSHTGFDTISAAAAGQAAGTTGQSIRGHVTPDGRYVVFDSTATNLVLGDGNSLRDVFVRDTQTNTTARVSVAANGAQLDGDSFDADITPDGHYVVFASRAQNLIPGLSSSTPQIYRKNLQTGAVDLVSGSEAGIAGSGDSINPSVSADGRFVVFESTSTDFPSTTITAANVFLKDMVTGKVVKISAGFTGQAAFGGGQDPEISADGRTIAFVSASSNLVQGDTNGRPDVFVASNPFLDATPTNVDLIRTSVSYTLPEGVEQLVLTGSSGLSGTGNALDNVLTGNAAANVLDGGAGKDTLVGGTGDDIYRVDNPDDVVQEAPNQGNDRVVAMANYILPLNVERLVLDGSSNLNGTGNAQANVLEGNDGSNVLAGGDGDDQYVVGLGDTVVEAAGGGFDVVRSLGSFVMPEHVEQLILTGNAAVPLFGNTGENALIGNMADNTLDGGRGGDALAGGLGNDSYRVDNALDQITEAAAQGDDGVTTNVSYALPTNLENLTLTQQAGNATGTGNAGNNVLEGNGRANVLDGGAGNDILRGLGGEDVLIGGVGDDRLSGGAGRDTLYGDAGADKFVFDSAINGVVNVDLIVDFVRGVDRIELASAIFGGLGSADVLSADRFVGGAGATAQDALDRIVHDIATGMLYYDADGSGAQGMVAFAQVAPGLALSAGDFIVSA